MHHYKSAYFITVITAIFAAALVYYGVLFLDLVPTLENFNRLYRDSEITYPELKSQLQVTSNTLIVLGGVIAVLAISMLSKFKYAIHALLFSLLVLSIFSYFSFDTLSFSTNILLSTILALIFLAYQKSFSVYRDNFFLPDSVTNILKVIVKILIVLTILASCLFYFLLSEYGTNSSASIDTMVYEVKFADGSEYKGEMENNLPHGKGEMSWPNGKQYSGTFVMGNIEGQGRLVTETGMVYEGDIKDAIPEGMGKVELPSGYSYEGAFTSGSPNGTGQCFSPAKGSYQCTYEMGKEK